ncbi:FUSC family protein [Pseudomonas sp. JS3066]|uniref:FUSC family protein n=1 Tax=Pseudomonas sp. JS3066 TaxID=3090665 RepID=UPI002E7BA36E|nr:FUSC family protein [Pseudomonas sp. JS3066]WVK95092.1 FUSC family protein [Pseudomonas sp. JS3066]
MRTLLKQSLHWHAGAPAWGPALMAGLGCGLPLVLGLFTSHTGFLWAATGAFQASLANPLHRLGMLRMTLLTGLGALAAGMGFWVASHPLLSLFSFALMGLLMAALQRFGNELGKLGAGLAVCLCLGQGQAGLGNLNNGMAVGALFAIGGLWVMLLAFALRAYHGLRLWPLLPSPGNLAKVARRLAQRMSHRLWFIHALACSLAGALAGLAVNLTGLPRGYWLTLTVLTTIQMDLNSSLQRGIQRCVGSLVGALILIGVGSWLQSPALLVACLLPLIFFSRAFIAQHYGLFVVQTTVCFVLLAESLSRDWHLPELRLYNSLLGAGLAMLVAYLAFRARLHWGTAPAPSMEMARQGE